VQVKEVEKYHTYSLVSDLHLPITLVCILCVLILVELWLACKS